MKKLYVGNIPFQASEQDLQGWFSEGGIQVDNVNVVRDRYSNEPRGFAFVEISNDEEAERAIQSLNGKDFLGRALVVNEARPLSKGGKGRREQGRGRRRGSW